MKKFIPGIILALAVISCKSPTTYSIQIDEGAQKAEFIVSKLENFFTENGWERKTGATNYQIHLVNDSTQGSESYKLGIKKNSATISASDKNGFIYGGQELIEQYRNCKNWQKLQSKTETAHVGFRAIKYNLPWFAYRSNEAITIHTETCRDIKYWEKFLDMMAENRFNVLTLWNLHPFPYMIRPANFPYACQFESDEELAGWQTFYHQLFKMAYDRGIETYLVNWNIFVSEGFAKEHHLPRLGNISVQKGISPEIAKLAQQYNKECVTQVLNEYPYLTGFGVSLGEAMGGMTATEREEWILNTIIAGMQEVDRPVKLIHRVPFSAGLVNGGSTSLTTEKITRSALENITGMEGPIWLEAKFNWSHGHSTPKLVKVHGGELKDTYWNPPTEKFKMNWMIRNEDFFMLRWGVPDFIREHIALNVNEHIGGYYIGSECYIPALDYMTKLEHPQWENAFERQWLFYKLWGRLLYNTETEDEIFKDEFIYRYGKHGAALLEAYSMASQMPLLYASFIDVNNDKSLYSEGILARDRRDSSEFLNMNLMIKKGSLDPSFLSTREFVDRIIAEKAIHGDELTPLELADSLNKLSQLAQTLVRNIDVSNNIALQYEVADIRTWSKLADYFAEKLRGAVAMHTFERTGNTNEKEAAIAYLQKALTEWDKVIEITAPIYKEVPLTHLHLQDDNYFHWSRFRSFVVADIDLARNAVYVP